ncbi:hypothetical protein RchiOBHm_Chr4g0413491 [Rosa chinensis]|uniref:Uncharacterized protein n=1 Tax=Rosa chinensis TaxID=74649 RepID=A0A2P6QW46_ROSCH|nr:hypothetical protein RchiOBHm_Chr4g0413491 [Rosa chinensis]
MHIAKIFLTFLIFRVHFLVVLSSIITIRRTCICFCISRKLDFQFFYYLLCSTTSMLCS